MYNSSISAGPTGTGTGTVLTSYVAPAPPSSSAGPSASPQIVQEASDGQVFVSATPVEAGLAATPSSSVAVPVEAGIAATPPSLVAVKAEYHPPAPVKPEYHPPAPAPSPPVSFVPPSLPASSQPASPSASSGSTSGSTGSTGVKARGLLYSYNNGQLSPEDSLAEANAAISDAVGWMANWDSSPETASGAASGSGKVEYVAQLLSMDHVANWQTNAVTPWLMAFNEPDNCGGGGACMFPVSVAVEGYNEQIAPLRKGNTKVTTPCTQNNVGVPGIGSDYMDTFLASFPPNSFDAICCHWYGPGTQEGLNGSDNPQSLAATVIAYQKLQTKYHIAELWISEGGPEDGTSDMINTFLEWLDDPSNGVDRYLWNGLNSPTSVVEVGAGSIYMST